MHNNSFSDANQHIKDSAVLCGWADQHNQEVEFCFNTLVSSLEGAVEHASSRMSAKDKYFDLVEETFKEMLQLIKDKSHDYSEGDDPFVNFRTSEELGVDKLVGLNVRLLDKVARIKSFSRSGNLKNESIKDAYKDLIGYSMLALGMIEEDERSWV